MNTYQNLTKYLVIFFIFLISNLATNYSFAQRNLEHSDNLPYDADLAEESMELLGLKHNKYLGENKGAFNFPDELVVAVSDLGHKPYYYVENHTLFGSDIELMQHIAKKLNIKLKWKIMPFHKLENELKKTNVDVAISMLSVNEERQKKYLLSKPYAETTGRFIFKDKQTYRNYLNKKYHLLFVAAVYGTSYNYYLNRNGFSVHLCNEKTQCHIYFLNQEVNAGMGETFVLKDFINEQLENPYNQNAKNYMLSEAIFTERLVILTQKRNTFLMNVINKTIQQLDEEGILKKISAKYFDDENVYKYFDE